MTPRREELDETIDRVAAALTLVPADRALAGRIAERIGNASDAFAWRGLVAAAVGVAVVAMVVALLTDARQDSIEAPLVTAPAPAPVERAPALAEAPPVPSLVAPVEPRVAVQWPQGVRPAPSRIAEAGGVPQIAALPLPVRLDVPDLPTDPLTIAPVDLAPLELASLAVAELEDRDDPKE